MYRLDNYILWGLIVNDLYVNKPTLYSRYSCRLIILISFIFRSVVRAASGKINFTAHVCIDLHLFLRTSPYPFDATDEETISKVPTSKVNNRARYAAHNSSINRI